VNGPALHSHFPDVGAAAAFARASNEHLTMHLVYVEAIEIDCQPIINVVGIRAATATIECQMVGGMGGEAPVANKFCRQLIVARVGADRQDGKRCRGE